jgi:putative tryptophan/tyrosine transport system substrate-binding protein
MRRRELITLLGAAAAWPLATRAQQALPVVGFMDSGSRIANAHLVAALWQGLNETGYVEGQNVAIEYRWAEGQYDRLPGLAADLVRRVVAVIVTTGGEPSARAAQAATTTIPIVFDSSSSPVELGMVASLNRPGGNMTGVNQMVEELVAKELGLLHELTPTLYVRREFAAAGGLMGYGTSLADAYRQVGIYAGRVLKGAKPAELPVVQPTRFDLEVIE